MKQIINNKTHIVKQISITDSDQNEYTIAIDEQSNPHLIHGNTTNKGVAHWSVLDLILNDVDIDYNEEECEVLITRLLDDGYTIYQFDDFSEYIKYLGTLLKSRT